MSCPTKHRRRLSGRSELKVTQGIPSSARAEIRAVMEGSLAAQTARPEAPASVNSSSSFNASAGMSVSHRRIRIWIPVLSNSAWAWAMPSSTSVRNCPSQLGSSTPSFIGGYACWNWRWWVSRGETYPLWRMASSTRSRTSSRTCALPFSTRSTVPRETLAIWATVCIVGLEPMRSPRSCVMCFCTIYHKTGTASCQS